ncbi:hypothetical protein RI367_000957 [Sorochytrium milnesiophthora]
MCAWSSISWVANIRHVDPSDPGNLDITVGMNLVQASTVQDMKRGLPATLRRVTPRATSNSMLFAIALVVPGSSSFIVSYLTLFGDGFGKRSNKLQLTDCTPPERRIPPNLTPAELLYACMTDDDIAWGIPTAAAGNHLPVIEYLCDERPELDVAQALAAAVEKGNLEIVKLLHPRCPAGCSESADCETLGRKHWDVLKYFHDNGNKTSQCDKSIEYLKEALAQRK